MNREELFSAITEIRDDYITEADPARKVSAPMWKKARPWLSMAAALIVVIGLVTLAKKLPMFQSKMEPTTEEAASDLAAPAAMEEGTNAGEVLTEEAPVVEEPAEAPAPETYDYQDTTAVGGAMEESEPAEDIPAAEEPEAEAVEEKRVERPQQIHWNGTAYTRSGETLDESPAGFDYAGMLETDPEAEFYSGDPASSGYSIYTSDGDNSRLYLAVPEGFLGYTLGE